MSGRRCHGCVSFKIIVPCNKLRHKILSGPDLDLRDPTRLKASQVGQTVEDDPLRDEVAFLQRRLARKIELISPILESLEFRYTRGNLALEPVVRASRELRDGIDNLARRLEKAAVLEERSQEGPAKAASRRIELLAIMRDTKELIITIDDAVPLINLWVSSVGGIQAQPSSFSPSRLLQASMLVNVGDSQYVLDPGHPMQIGPDFTLSLYMLFRGHASADGEAYGIEDGQRKPTWQEVIHKARVRLYRVPVENDGLEQQHPSAAYAYQLQIVEDLDDGRVHTFENGNSATGSYNGVTLAGIRERVPVGQISKMFYADVGRILNINNEDGASGSPVLLLKRDVRAVPEMPTDSTPNNVHRQEIDRIHEVEESITTETISDDTLPESSSQDDIDRQLREESQAQETAPTRGEIEEVRAENCDRPTALTEDQPSSGSSPQWSFPQNLDPEWIALEVFEMDEADSSSDDDDEPTPEEESEFSTTGPPRKLAQDPSHASVDSNLVTQLHRMSLASTPSVPSSRPSSRESSSQSHHPTALTTSRTSHGPTSVSPSLLARSPFGAIRTSLSLLEILLRLASLQEFEQTTHLAITDHVLKFYLDESASTTGLSGAEGWAARAEAAQKVGFDPFSAGAGDVSSGL